MKRHLLLMIAALLAAICLLASQAMSQEAIELSAEFDENYANPKEWHYWLTAQCINEFPIDPPQGSHFEWYYDEDGGSLQHFASTSTPSTSLDDNIEDHGTVYVEWWYGSYLVATSNGVYVYDQGGSLAVTSGKHQKQSGFAQEFRPLLVASTTTPKR